MTEIVVQPSDQVCRDSADTVHRQGYCRAYYDTATDPSGSDCADDGETPQTQFIGSVAPPAINQVTKHVEIPLTQYINKVIAAIIMMQRQAPQIQTVPKTGDATQTLFIGSVVDVPVIMLRVPQIHTVPMTGNVPKMQFIGKIVDVPVITQRQVPQLQTVTKTVEAPKMQFIGKIVDVHVIMQRQVPQIQTVAKTVNTPKMRFIDNFVNVPVITQRQVPQLQTVAKTVEAPRMRFIDSFVDVPVSTQRQVPQLQTVARNIRRLPRQPFVPRVASLIRFLRMTHGSPRRVPRPLLLFRISIS